MKSRLLSVLLVFFLVASVSIPAVSAMEYTPTITCTKEVKNSLGCPIGELTLKGYFGYDHQKEHEVVKYYNTNETSCRMTVKSSLELGVASVLHQQRILEITCDKHGNTRTDIR